MDITSSFCMKFDFWQTWLFIWIPSWYPSKLNFFGHVLLYPIYYFAKFETFLTSFAPFFITTKMVRYYKWILPSTLKEKGSHAGNGQETVYSLYPSQFLPLCEKCIQDLWVHVGFTNNMPPHPGFNFQSFTSKSKHVIEIEETVFVFCWL